MLDLTPPEGSIYLGDDLEEGYLVTVSQEGPVGSRELFSAYEPTEEEAEATLVRELVWRRRALEDFETFWTTADVTELTALTSMEHMAAQQLIIDEEQVSARVYPASQASWAVDIFFGSLDYDDVPVSLCQYFDDWTTAAGFAVWCSTHLGD